MMTTHPLLRTASPIDGSAPTFDATDTLVLTVEAEPSAVVETLARVDPAASLARALDALGVGDRVVRPPAILTEKSGMDIVFGLIWRVLGPAERGETTSVQAFESPGHVKVFWDVRVRAGATGGSLLTATTRFAATDDATRGRLLAGWATIGAVTRVLARRTLAAVKAAAEEDEELGPANAGAALPVSSRRLDQAA